MENFQVVEHPTDSLQVPPVPTSLTGREAVPSPSVLCVPQDPFHEVR